MASFAKRIVDEHLAPKVSEFTSADIPDMSKHCKESRFWLANHFLNSALSGAYGKQATRQCVFNYLRRAEAAFAHHELAREATLKFLGGSRQSLSEYMRALNHWESFLAQSWMGYRLLMYLFEEKNLYKQGDGSKEAALNHLYNRSKHVDSAIAAGEQMPESGNLAVWMTNAGLASVELSLNWAQTSEILAELAQFAMALEDPTTAKEKLEQLDDAQPP